MSLPATTASFAFATPPRQQQRATAVASQEPDPEVKTLAEIDQEYHCLGCLGHGGFASVYLAQKIPSNRLVALKFFRREVDHKDHDDNNDDVFSRELDAVLKLDRDENVNHSADTQRHHRAALSLVFFQDWFVGPTHSCIVMNYVDGGSLAQDIESRGGGGVAQQQQQSSLPAAERCYYTERRIASYAFQLANALAFAHQRGVAHFDVTSSNVLIDRSDGGGRLLLCDFSAAISATPGQDEPWQFSRRYAPYEVLQAFETQSFDNLEPKKVDAFGLGCILFELLCCRRLKDISEQTTLAECIAVQPNVSADAILDWPDVKLPWLPPENHGMQDASFSTTLGYSHALRSVVKTLLEHNPQVRHEPAELAGWLQNSPTSPLLAGYVSAAQAPRPGAFVTIDNIQLGMFVQWNQVTSTAKVGVVVGLDPDAGYTQVAFPGTPPIQSVARIGARNTYELRVGPVSIDPAVSGNSVPMTSGLLSVVNADAWAVGQPVFFNRCMVVAKQSGKIFVAPTKPISRPLPLPLPFSTLPEPLPHLPLREPMPPPSTWEENSGLFSDLPLSTHSEEKASVLKCLFAPTGGLNPQRTKIVSIRRIQKKELWKKFAKKREEVAADNWGVVNEKRFVHGTRSENPETVLSAAELGLFDFPEFPIVGAQTAFRCQPTASTPGSAPYTDMNQVIVSRVALGRVAETQRRPVRNSVSRLTCHSSMHKTTAQQGVVYSVRDPKQFYPEYIVSYLTPQDPGNGTTTNPPSSPSTPKTCVICMERAVSHITVPCGHPCLCQNCSSPSHLARLRMRCPECRSTIERVMKFYGTVVEN